MTKPDCAWALADLKTVPQNGITVMSTFACGGGSSMGYKRAGCTIVAANDIDPEMAWHYQRNLNPPLYYLCPIRDLLTADLPPELFALDILDGSPPCSTFSMAGSREKAWGKEKHFREGQAKQVLSDLFFDYLDLVGRLRPKVAIAENVKGMLLGNAKGYTKLVMARFKELGYRPQLFLLNAADCGVPQRRERVFFCALRDDIDRPPLKLEPRHRWISAGEACSGLTVDAAGLGLSDATHKQWQRTPEGETLAVGVQKLTGTRSRFNEYRLSKLQPANALSSQSQNFYHWETPRRLHVSEWKRLGSFPDDYHAKTDRIGKYMIGMSVPPKMTEAVARAVIDQWLL
jgi:DNA (cytosine-5)-methyltransferase 1